MADDKYKHYAWCPSCFDALDIKEILDTNSLISEHRYYCFGCDKTFKLEQVQKND